MKVTKLGTDYLITDKGTNNKKLEITAYVSKDGVTLFRKDHQLDFNFIESDPVLLGKLARMFLKASKL